MINEKKANIILKKLEKKMKKSKINKKKLRKLIIILQEKNYSNKDILKILTIIISSFSLTKFIICFNPKKSVKTNIKEIFKGGFFYGCKFNDC